mgnify:CR=1 FL=1
MIAAAFEVSVGRTARRHTKREKEVMPKMKSKRGAAKRFKKTLGNPTIAQNPARISPDTSGQLAHFVRKLERRSRAR